MDNLELNVTGMSFQGCVSSVTRVLKAVPGVSEVNVTLQPPLARVAYDGGRTTTAALKAAVEDAGYGVAP